MTEEKITGVCLDIPTVIREAKLAKAEKLGKAMAQAVVDFARKHAQFATLDGGRLITKPIQYKEES